MITTPTYFRDHKGQMKQITELNKIMDSLTETFHSNVDQKWWCVKHGHMSGWLESGHVSNKDEWRWGETREHAQLKLWNDFVGHHTTNYKHYGGKDILGRAGM